MSVDGIRHQEGTTNGSKEILRSIAEDLDHSICSVDRKIF
jgi:hypothetical protein